MALAGLPRANNVEHGAKAVFLTNAIARPVNNHAFNDVPKSARGRVKTSKPFEVIPEGLDLLLPFFKTAKKLIRAIKRISSIFVDGLQ